MVFIEAFFISIESDKMNNFKLNSEIFKYKLDAKSLHIYCYLIANKNRRVRNDELKNKLNNLSRDTLAQSFNELKIKKLISPKPILQKNIIKSRFIYNDFVLDKKDNITNILTFNSEIFKYNLSHRAFQVYLYLRANLDKHVLNKQITDDLYMTRNTLAIILRELKKNNLLNKKTKKHNKIICIF